MGLVVGVCSGCWCILFQFSVKIRGKGNRFDFSDGVMKWLPVVGREGVNYGYNPNPNYGYNPTC